MKKYIITRLDKLRDTSKQYYAGEGRWTSNAGTAKTYTNEGEAFGVMTTLPQDSRVIMDVEPFIDRMGM